MYTTLTQNTATPEILRPTVIAQARSRTCQKRARQAVVQVPTLRNSHGILLMSVLPAAVVWVPLVRQSGFGTLTLLDILLSLLWGTTFVRLRGAFFRYTVLKRAFRIALYALMSAALGVLGALLYDSNSQLVPDLMHQLKRFVMPAVIPLALLVAPRAYVARVRSVLIASVVLMVLIGLTPLATLLPINQDRIDGRATQSRAEGSLANPNDFAYVGLFGALAGLSHLASRSRTRTWRACVAAVAVGAGFTALVTSASRSGMAAAIAATLHIALTSGQSVFKKGALIACLATAAAVGWRLTPSYHDRMGAVLSQQTSESSAYARIEAQRTGIRTWLHHPLGVGFTNTYAATQPYAYDAQVVTGVAGSDSIYVDFLLGTGIFGFACLLLCFRNCWDLARCRTLDPEVKYLKAGILSAFAFGLATVSPASYVVAPFFFTFAGLAASSSRTDFKRRAVRT